MSTLGIPRFQPAYSALGQGAGELARRVQRCCAGDVGLLRAVLLETAARALVYPQLATGDRAACAAAIRSASAAPLAPSASALGPADEAQVAARECLRGALEALSRNPDDLFETTVLAFERSQSTAIGARFHKFVWVGWLDDAVCRASRMPHAELLEAMATCVDASLPIDGATLLEGVGCEDNSFEVWSRAGVRGKLVRPLLRAERLELRGGVLSAPISDAGLGVSDRLRVEYFVEHLIHRIFLADRYRGMFAKWHYRVGSTGFEWENPA